MNLELVLATNGAGLALELWGGWVVALGLSWAWGNFCIVRLRLMDRGDQDIYPGLVYAFEACVLGLCLALNYVEPTLELDSEE